MKFLFSLLSGNGMGIEKLIIRPDNTEKVTPQIERKKICKRNRKFMRNRTLLFLSTFATLTAKAEPSTIISTPTVESYISKYRLITQLESYRSGIPASIILAQAILESGYGNSALCKKSNNHFGIKWKNKDDGEFVYALDDDYDKNGKHIPSKFIKYEDDAESFHHHSDFLKNRPHYSALFKFDRADFVNWAYGLRTCGYSTDASYGAQLIQLIRKYKLNAYDLAGLNNKTVVKCVEDTKILVNILTAQISSWDILLKKKTVANEQSSLAIANEPKIQTHIEKCLETPLLPIDNHNKQNSKSWMFIRKLFSLRFGWI